MNRSKDVVEITRETYDQTAVDYSSMVNELVTNSWVGKFEQNLLDDFLSFFKSVVPKILDIGCGNGKDTAYLMQKGANVIGVDYSSGMLEEARKHVAKGVFIQMDMRSLQLSNEVFDGAWANGCIYHVPKNSLATVLTEILRVLNPSGVLSFNFKLGVGEKLEDAPRSFQKGPRFYAYYKKSEMKKCRVRSMPSATGDYRIRSILIYL
ncbi:Trans-aconitate 2-methyltransferase [subsurface metagenome]